MKRIIITAILAAICTVGGATSFVMNDLPSYTAWKQDNAQQFKKTPKYDGIDQQKDKYYDNDKDYKKVNDHKDDKDNKNETLICEQLYDLAMMSHKQLSPEEMTKFVKRSNDILLKLAEA